MIISFVIFRQEEIKSAANSSLSMKRSLPALTSSIFPSFSNLGLLLSVKFSSISLQKDWWYKPKNFISLSLMPSFSLILSVRFSSKLSTKNKFCWKLILSPKRPSKYSLKMKESTSNMKKKRDKVMKTTTVVSRKLKIWKKFMMSLKRMNHRKKIQSLRSYLMHSKGWSMRQKLKNQVSWREVKKVNKATRKQNKAKGV